MNLLIVDDEIITVETLRDHLPWKEIGVTNVYTANDVAFAKSVFSSFQIDILLCDIEMPGDSGIDLLKWLREQSYSQVVTVLLTCHEVFIYAKDAISLGVFEYSLKPISFNDLTLILKKAVAESMLLYKSKDTLIRTFWMDYFNSNEMYSNQNLKALNLFDSNDLLYTLLTFKICHMENNFKTTDLINLLSKSLDSIFKNLSLNFSIFQYRKKYIYMVIWGKESNINSETISVIYDNLKNQINNLHINQTNLCVCIDSFTSLESLKIMADSFMNFLENNNSLVYGIFQKEISNVPLLIEKISKYIQEHLSEEFSRNELADYVFLNKDYLGRVFKKETGMNLMEYVRMQRLLKAKYLLKNTELSISDISSSVGFNSLSHFSNLFKITFKMSPNDYRNQ